MHLFYTDRDASSYNSGIIMLAEIFRGFLIRIKHHGEIMEKSEDHFQIPEWLALPVWTRHLHVAGVMILYKKIMKCSGLLTVFSANVCADALSEQWHKQLLCLWLPMGVIAYKKLKYAT